MSYSISLFSISLNFNIPFSATRTCEDLIETFFKRVDKVELLLNPYYVNNGKKEILNVEIYDKNNIINKIDENKIYKMASTDIILNEDSFDDFQQKNILNIINDKLKKNLVKCSNKDLNEILYEYFKEKKIINLNNIKRYNKERIVFVK